MRQTIFGDIVHGTLHVSPSWRKALQEALLVWPDGPATVTVEREQATRSVQANAYYWGVVVRALSEYTGSTPDEMHECLKLKFLPKDIAFRRGNGRVMAEFVIGGSTAALYTSEFYDYVEQIRQWAFEALDVPIPPPDPEWRAHAEAERAERERNDHGRTDTPGESQVSGGDAAAPRVEKTRGGRRPRRLGAGGVGAGPISGESGADAD